MLRHWTVAAVLGVTLGAAQPALAEMSATDLAKLAKENQHPPKIFSAQRGRLGGLGKGPLIGSAGTRRHLQPTALSAIRK
jgi:hypothetical protein